MKSLYITLIALAACVAMNGQTLPAPVYFNDFENGLGEGVTQVGSGAVESINTPNFNHVYHNAINGQAVCTNYLKLPSTIFSFLNSADKELTIGLWLNIGTATNFYWSPVFTAYGTNGNSWPMMAWHARKEAHINCAGWVDLLNAETQGTQYLDDGAWHYYTGTVTATSCKIYVDGTLIHEWITDGTDAHSSTGLLTNGNELINICLGGNQAFGWQDPDPAFLFDDVAIYSVELTADQINQIITAKTSVTSVKNVSADAKVVSEAYYNAMGQKLNKSMAESLKGMMLIKKQTLENGKVVTAKVINQ